MLDGYGGVHVFGGIAINTSGAPYWHGWDIARAVVILPTGNGGWTLDGWGGVHSWGSAPPISAAPYDSDPSARSPVYTRDDDKARALVILGGGTAGYVMQADGSLHGFGGAPQLSGSPIWPNQDIARGLEVHLSGGNPDGGWILRADGTIVPFGAAPSLSASLSASGGVWLKLHNTGQGVVAIGRWGITQTLSGSPAPNWTSYFDWGSWDILRDIVLTNPVGGSGAQPISTAASNAYAAATTPNGGITLDDYGGVHPFGGLWVDTTGLPYWSGWQIARAEALAANDIGGWTLDGYGGVHPWGAAPPIAAPTYSTDPRARAPVYWNGDDIARDLIVLKDNVSGYVLDGHGDIHPFGTAPTLSGAPSWPDQDVARGLTLHYSADGTPDGGWMLRIDGVVTPFGAATATASQPSPQAAIWQHIHGDGVHLYAVAKWGIIQTLSPGVSPRWDGYQDWGAWDILRDITLVALTNAQPQTQPSSGPAIGAFNDAGHPDGGVVLDGYGGVHSFGALTLDLSGAPYWHGWDIARAVALYNNGAGGWTLDGYGGVHNWGAAPPIAAPAYSSDPNARAAVYWQGWDIARDLVVLPDNQSGYILDGYGGVHPFGPSAPALGGYAYWHDWDIARGLDIHLDANDVPVGGIVVNADGGTYPFGTYPQLATAPNFWAGRDLSLKLHTVDGAAFAVNRWGGIQDLSGTGIEPYWSGYSDWGGLDILRDIRLVGGYNQQPVPQPQSAAASTAYWNTVETYAIPGIPSVRQAYPLDCEAAALRAALFAKGMDVSEAWILNQIGSDGRPAVWDNHGNIMQWGNPYQIFVGNVYGSEPRGTGYGVYYPPLAAAAQAAGRPASYGEQGMSPGDLYLQVARGNPAIIWTDTTFQPVGMRWWTSWDGQSIPYAIGEHAVTVVAVDAWHSTVTVLDVEYGSFRTFSKAQFESFWSSFNHMAVVVR